MENLHEGHRQRLKQQFLDNGLKSFQTHNILELLLFYARPRIDTNEIAHILLNKYGTLSAVLNAPYEELVEIKGLGDNGATLIKLIPELLSVYSVDTHASQPMDNLKTVCNYFFGCYIGVKNEQFRVCCLDDNLHIVSCSVIQDGGVNAVAINMRKIVETTYRSNSSVIIIAHNHPNGIPVPSDADIAATKQMYTILQSVGIRMIDHIIVGKNHAISMKDTGYFNIFEN